MKNLCILFILFVSLGSVRGQSTNLVFKSDISPFFVELDGVKQNKQAAHYIRINRVNKKSVHAKVIFTGTISTVSSELTYKTGDEVHFEVKKVDDDLSINWEKDLVMEAALPLESGQIEVDYIDAQGKVHKEAPKKEAYKGEKGCSRPTPTNRITNCKYYMEENKESGPRYSTATKSLKDLCLSTEQVTEILEMLDDNYKAKFVIFSYKNLYDLDNIQVLMDQLSADSQAYVTKKLKL